MLEAIIFDLDGVIVDSHAAHRQAWKTFLHSVGKDPSEEQLQFVVEGHKREAILRHFLGDLSEDQVRHYGARKEALFKDSVPELKTVLGVGDFLAECEDSGLRLALASSASRRRAEYILEHLDMKRRFRVVLTGDDVDNGKPDPTIFHLAAHGLGVDPGRILVCEDAVCGVEAAKAAGMKCLAIAANGRGPLLETAGADRVAPNFGAVDLDGLRGLFE